VGVFGLLYAFLIGVNGLGDGFTALGRGVTDQLLALTDNPFMGLIMGILTTTLVQSSSVTTSLVVGLVAAPESPLPVANAVPIIMGANIGTTVTNLVVALAHMGRREDFRRAFGVAAIHDVFNFMTVAVLLPLELLTGYLRHTASFLAGVFGGLRGVEYDSPIKEAVEAGVGVLETGIGAVVEAPQARGVTLIVVSCLLIAGTLMLLVRVMRSAMRARVESMVLGALERRLWLGMLLGVVATVMVQSSSITTSLLVPLAGAGVLTMPQALPITLGANLGTTVTALLAALAATGVNAEAGLTIALVHLLFNATGTLMILPWPSLRRLPVWAASGLAGLAVRSRIWTLVAVATVFYGVPILLAVLDFLWQ